MRITKLITVPKQKAKRLEGLCNTPHKKFPPNKVVYQLEVDFGDFMMRLQIMSPDKPDVKPCWTRAILYRKVVVNDRPELVEAGKIPRGDTFLRDYHLFYVGNDIHAIVQVGDVKKIKVSTEV